MTPGRPGGRFVFSDFFKNKVGVKAGGFLRIVFFPSGVDFHDYLMGIPFDFEFWDYKITEFLESLEINPDGKEYDAEKSARYSYLIFKEI